MARLIDADKLRKDVLDLPDCYNGFSDTYDKARILDLVDEQPTVKPYKHGYWRLNGNRFCECSVCHAEGNLSSHDYYCRNCGAKMDGAET